MATEQARQCAERFIELLRGIEKNEDAAIAAITELFADEAELTNPLIKHHDTRLQGRARVEGFWKGYRANFREIESQFSHVMTSADAAGLFWRSRGTDAQGAPVDYEGVSLLELNAQGKIRRFRAFFDSLQLQRRLD